MHNIGTTAAILKRQREQNGTDRMSNYLKLIDAALETYAKSEKEDLLAFGNRPPIETSAKLMEIIHSLEKFVYSEDLLVSIEQVDVETLSTTLHNNKTHSRLTIWVSDNGKNVFVGHCSGTLKYENITEDWSDGVIEDNLSRML